MGVGVGGGKTDGTEERLEPAETGWLLVLRIFGESVWEAEEGGRGRGQMASSWGGGAGGGDIHDREDSAQKAGWGEGGQRRKFVPPPPSGEKTKINQRVLFGHMGGPSQPVPVGLCGKPSGENVG